MIVPLLVDKILWPIVVLGTHFLVVPSIMLYAGIMGLGTERRLRRNRKIASGVLE